MKGTWEIVLSGVGGQGLLSIGNLLGEAASIFGGKKATMTASYGVETRGTFTKSDVIISDEEIDFPEVLNPDIVLCLAQVSYDRYRDTEKPCILIYDSDTVKPGNEPEGHIGFPILSRAVAFEARESVNIIAMGVIVGLAAPAEPEHILALFDKKYASRPQLQAKMKKLFGEGVNMGRESR
nr:2-oxoacid:acceptor oxidoreductase family protein [uncultured Fretibacterium sp.]